MIEDNDRHILSQYRLDQASETVEEVGQLRLF